MQNTIEKSISQQSISVTSQRKLCFLALEAMFAGAIFLISQRSVADMPTWLLVLLVLATFRMARTISFNEIGEVIRAPFTEIKADSCGAGANVHPREGGFTYVIGSLMACPICSGTWSALVLVGIWSFFPAIGQVLIMVLGVAGGSEMLHWLGEKLEWEGRQARVVSGKISPDKE